VVARHGKIRAPRLPLEEAAGAYQIEATLDGLPARRWSRQTEERRQQPDRADPPADVQNRPIVTDLPTARWCSTTPAAARPGGGQLTLDRWPRAKHTVKVANRSSELRSPSRWFREAHPWWAALRWSKNLAALLVTSFGNRARVVQQAWPAKVTVDPCPPAIWFRGAGIKRTWAGARTTSPLGRAQASSRK